MTQSVERSEIREMAPFQSWPGRAPECDQEPLRATVAIRGLARCVATTARLLRGRQIRQPTDHIGDILFFADGSSAPVYRETVVCRPHVGEATALVVQFKLRWIRGRGHALFRAESLLNTPLFVGFPGFVSKLWLAHDEHGAYRGVYEWNDTALAHTYARTLWWVLAVVSEPASIHYTVIPGCTRAELLAAQGAGNHEWWRVTALRRRPASAGDGDGDNDGGPATT